MMLARFADSPFCGIETGLDRLFDGFADGLSARRGPCPPMNVWEEGDALYADVDVPGLKLEDVEVFVIGNELTIKGKREFEKIENAEYYRHERVSGSFSRTLALPSEVEPEKVEATLKDGVLTVKLPKAESEIVRKIAVKSE